MVVNFIGSADQAVIYTGDDMHNYDLRHESNTGFVVDKGLFTYSYSTPGVYKVVCVASTYTDKATDLKRDTCSFTVTVTDDVTEILKLSCPQILYDEVFASKLSNDEWLMTLPRKVRYNNQTPSISLSQRLRFYIQSDSAKVFINESLFSATQRYNLSSPVDISVKSHQGTIRPYKLFTIYYPEFTTFKLAGVTGTLVRNEYDYSTFEMKVTLPVGTDVSNLKPEFEMFSPTDKVFIDDVEQTSNISEVNFSQNVTYRLTSTVPGNPDKQATSFVVVKINFQ